MPCLSACTMSSSSTAPSGQRPRPTAASVRSSRTRSSTARWGARSSPRSTRSVAQARPPTRLAPKADTLWARGQAREAAVDCRLRLATLAAFAALATLGHGSAPVRAQAWGRIAQCLFARCVVSLPVCAARCASANVTWVVIALQGNCGDRGWLGRPALCVRAPGGPDRPADRAQGCRAVELARADRGPRRQPPCRR